ncbi:hypothetical protein D3C76_988760 [compost metagenome]|nr:hypothetical protein PPUN110474_24250 [Pseudomonas putida]
MRKPEKHSAEGRAAVKALREFLHYVIAHPEKFVAREEIIKAFSSQGAMVSLKAQIDTDEGSIELIPISLNTAKKYASLFLATGFDELEKLRAQANSALKTTSIGSTGKTTKEGLKLQKSNLEAEIESLINSNFNLLQCVSIAMGALENVRQERDPQQREKIIRDTGDTIKAALGINIPPFNTTPTGNKVTPIGQRRAKN